jgi:hypothetical protein
VGLRSGLRDNTSRVFIATQEIAVYPNAPRARILLAIVAGLTASGGLYAQVASPKVVISNTTPLAEIGLETGSNVEFAANGDLQIRCRKTGDSCVTANIGGGGSTGTNPPTNVSLTPSATTLTAGNAFNLQWSSTNAEACFGLSTPSVSGWSNQVLATNRGSPGQALSLTTPGSYTFQLRCFNAGGSNTATAPTVTVNPGGGGGGGDYCSEYYASGMPTGSAFNGHGFTRVDVPFFNVWGAQPGFSAGITAGVPGNFVNPSTARYMAIPFTLLSDSGTGTQVNLSWVEAQQVGISTGAVTVTISPCPGDFRPPATGSSDIYLSFQCRAAASIGAALSATSVIGQSGCRAPKDKQMYINIATYDMFVTNPPTQSTCSGSSTCGVAMRLL